MKNQKKSFAAYFVIMLALILTTVSTAQAATFIVNSDTDQNDLVPGDGVCAAAYRTCTLRAAIQEANALKHGDSIKFSSSFEAPNAPKTIVLTLGQLQVDETLFVVGPGARQLAIDGNHTSRVLFLSSTVQNAFIKGVTIQNGYAYNEPIYGTCGAGICNYGHYLSLVNVTVRNNDSTGDSQYFGGHGGGIANHQIMTVIGSTIVGNKAGYGGGIQNHGTMNIVNSTISGNDSQNAGGGGISNIKGKMTIANSTVTDNHSVIVGGGVHTNGYGTVEMVNTIVADNDAPFGADVNGNITSLGNNLVKNRAGSSGYVASDLPDGTDPLLGVLQNNGGQTDTRELLAGSPAINAGNNCVSDMPNCLVGVGYIFNDQRGEGFPRRVGSAIDIGAFEFSVTRGVKIGGIVLKPNGRGLNNALVTLAVRGGEPRSVETDSRGYYSFDQVPTGETYIVKVESRQYEYAPQNVVVSEDRDDVNFTPVEKRIQ